MGTKRGDFLTINYPNGKPFSNSSNLTNPSSNKKDNEKEKQINYSRRGMSFEDLINETNIYYREHDIALVHKKPTPIQIVKVDYPHRSAAVIKEAYYKLASTTDYNGVYKGRYIDFEAKETTLQSFPLKNLHEHQIKHMQNVLKHNGIAFVLIHFKRFEEIYFISADRMIGFWERMISGGKKSITRVEIAECSTVLKIGFLPRIDYIKCVEQMYLKAEE